MVHMQGVIKKWGNSYGILIPKELLKEANLKENQTVDVAITPKRKTASKLFGLLKGKLKMTGQQVKDMAREELYDDW